MTAFEPQDSRRQSCLVRWGLSLLYALLTMAVILGALEGVARLLGERPLISQSYFIWERSDLSFRWRPGYEFDLLSISEQGLRDHLYEIPKPVGERRILIIGDSVVAGEGVVLEETFVKQLERDIAAPCVGPAVINGGTFNYNAEQIALWLEDYGYTFEPDLVIVTFFLNDPLPVFGRISTPGLVNFLTQKSAAFGWFISRNVERAAETQYTTGQFRFIDPYNEMTWRTDPEAFAALFEAASDNWAIAWDEDALDRALVTLDSLFDGLDARGIPGFLLISPAHPQVSVLDGAVPSDLDLYYPQRAITAWAEARGIPVIDPLERLSEEPWDLIYLDWVHYSVWGHTVVANVIAAHPALQAWCAGQP